MEYLGLWEPKTEIDVTVIEQVEPILYFYPFLQSVCLKAKESLCSCVSPRIVAVWDVKSFGDS